MRIYSLILLILLFLFIPIPLKIKFTYESFNLNLYIYNLKINLKKLITKINKVKNTKARKTKPAIKEKTISLSFQDVTYLIHEVNSLKYKPNLKFKLNLDYGLDDAAYTAITFGYLHSLFPILYYFISVIFNVKRYKIDINPKYNEILLEISVESIFSINIAKLIYISIKMFKAYKTVKNN